ncbi:hypothetical protein Sta7437_4520 (plasmid) [Stanieria cyanosphaera PCC 7437]|uniref:Uncharacterized protein n=1 Tax=Stanieria cyanosphaera (strain ATCC 29371 / PCC 7437) TaxID=111780 RepID=K9Y1W5_STAC7|nr:hypothetical protein [Stanieria cyanosphaera]AFZ37982.1 hypothetical protein Sta7437_4520 [Stanieria cyanosphaera PCC 7437]
MSHNQNNQNSSVTETGLKIPVIDLSLAESGRYLSEPENITDSLLELLGESNDLSSLVIVKLERDRGKQLQFEDPKLAEQIYLNQLDKVDFGDNIKRGIIFSSGKSVYFGNKELIDNIREQFFKTQPDHCCRYGSLLVSSCLQGAVLFDSSKDNSPIKLKIVDSQSNNPKEREAAADFFTGDCHGKISPHLAEEVGAKSKRPFQFRMAWMTGWNQNETKNSTPKTSFLAKGTFLPNRTLTEARGYDIILDRSSIKGIAKDKLSELIPCGDYQLPKMALGNRANAELQKYDNSWQFSIWFSKSAIASDLVPATKAEAQRLAQIQSNPLKLNRYIVEQHDKKASFIQTDDDAVSVEGSEDEREAKESRLVSLLRQDNKGLLTGYPKLVEFQRSQLRKIWLNLAIKGALHHDSAMAQPCDNLKPGTIVAPHLENGTEVIVTRYPIVSKDNIRRYTVDNHQPAAQSLLNYRSCVFIRSDQAMQHHQCDFDGDQLIVTPTSRFPQISQEIRRANEPSEYPSVVKREKTNYGKPKYTNLKQIAAAIKQNSIGYVATLIGRVQSSSNPYQKQSRREKFESAKVKLLGKLFDALQIEVDSPKSAARYQDRHGDIIARTKNWVENFPSPLFDYKKDERVYKTSCLPTSTDNNIDCIAERAVNPQWSRTRIKSLELDRFSFLFDEPNDKQDLKYWEQVCLPKAEEIKQRYRDRSREIHQANKDDPERKKQEFAQLYEDLRAIVDEEFPNAEERMLAASAMWKLETNNKSLKNHIAECKKLACRLNSTIELVKEHRFNSSLEPQNTWVVSVPFVRRDNSHNNSDVVNNSKNNSYRPLAAEFKAYLDKQGASYEATVNSDLPLIDFALIDPQPELIKNLQAKLGNNDNDRFVWQEHNLTTYKGDTVPLQIVPPKDYTWVEMNEENLAKGSLILNLFAAEICQRLEEYQFTSFKLIGAKHNDYSQVDFSDKRLQNKEFEFVVGKYNNPNDYRHGQPMVQLKSKDLAMFEPQSPRLPVGSTFTASIEQSKGALILHVKPESVRLPESELQKQGKKTTKAQQKRLKRKFYLDTPSQLPMDKEVNGNTQAKKKRNFCLNIEIPKSTAETEREPEPNRTLTQPTIKQLLSQDASIVLHQSIKSQHQKTGENQLKIDSKGEWTATIRGHNCKVCDRHKKIVFQSNLATDKIDKPLSEANAERFFKMCEQETKKESLNPQKSNRIKRKNKQEQLSI